MVKINLVVGMQSMLQCFQGQCECCIWVTQIFPCCVNVVFGCKIFVHAVWRSKMRGGSREEKCNSKRCHQLLPSHQSMCLGHFLQNIILQNITFFNLENITNMKNITQPQPPVNMSESFFPPKY